MTDDINPLSSMHDSIISHESSLEYLQQILEDHSNRLKSMEGMMPHELVQNFYKKDECSNFRSDFSTTINIIIDERVKSLERRISELEHQTFIWNVTNTSLIVIIGAVFVAFKWY